MAVIHRRLYLGMKDLFFGEIQDFTLLFSSILIITSFIYGCFLIFNGYIVPGISLITAVLKIVSFILDNTNV